MVHAGLGRGSKPLAHAALLGSLLSGPENGHGTRTISLCKATPLGKPVIALTREPQ